MGYYGTVKVSSKLRKGQAQYFHWCPACENMHPLPFKWNFDGNLESPTFTPSFKQNPDDQSNVCHYNVTSGKIQFHGDSWHKRTDLIDMPDLPESLKED